MREATGGAYLIYVALFFIGAVMLLFVSALSYNRSFKIKNHIIEIIESHGKFDKIDPDNQTTAEKAIMDYLRDVGYFVNSSYSGNGCPKYNGVSAVEKADSDSYEYCIYMYKNPDTKKVYYKVVTYAYFNFPVIDNLFRFKITGETKLMNEG